MDNLLLLDDNSFTNLEMDDSFIHRMNMDRARIYLDQTDDTLVKKRKNEARDHSDTDNTLNKARVKGELAQFAAPMTEEEKFRIVSRFAGEWENYFWHRIYNDDIGPRDVESVPKHPWVRLKEARDEEGGLRQLGLDRRYALRFVKTVYADMWRKL